MTVTCARVPVVYMGMKNRYVLTASFAEMPRDSREEKLDDTNA
jgi:hypothetical protein